MGYEPEIGPAAPSQRLSISTKLTFWTLPLRQEELHIWLSLLLGNFADVEGGDDAGGSRDFVMGKYRPILSRITLTCPVAPRPTGAAVRPHSQGVSLKARKSGNYYSVDKVLIDQPVRKDYPI